MILRSLQSNLQAVLANIEQSYLDRYKTLRERLLLTNVASDAQYQRIFNGFYKMRCRSEVWYRYYFELLEFKKSDPSVTFQTVLEQIHRDQSRVEPSFSSKLVATIRPEKPVYDKHVRDNLSLELPGARESARDRVNGFITMYASLEQTMNVLVKHPIFTSTLEPAFDAKFAAYAHFTDVKKLDLLLWQYREHGDD